VTAAAVIAEFSSIGRIGVALNFSHGTQGAVVRERLAAVSASMIATPPLLSAKA